uniref:Thrombomodulin n=1 Tax=Acanthochromis polyacanthus TaxID=80966 RepID=A0A3Q1G5L7_9TELE
MCVCRKGFRVMTPWLLLALGVFLAGAAGGLSPDSGYCIGNQCFTVFRDPSSFRTARQECGDRRGHLMTVRSSVSHDILALLLGNFTGRFWIGLHRPTGCPEEAAALRGFQWITDDTESDFSNWLPGSDSSCSSARCVSVSQENDLKWIQDPCGERAAGFLCEKSFNDMCGTLAAEPGQSDECVSAPCEHMCTNTPGSYRCSCYDGYRQNPHEPSTCTRYCGQEECAAECDPNDRYQCFCPEGYISEERGTDVFCIDMDECSFSYCDQLCSNTFGSYVCACSPGYSLVDEFRCVKTDDEDSDGGPEGSGMTAAPDGPTDLPLPFPGPTRRPSGVSGGGLVAIIVCTAASTLLLVLLGHYFCSRREKMENSGDLKASEEEAHGLHQVDSRAY